MDAKQYRDGVVRASAEVDQLNAMMREAVGGLSDVELLTYLQMLAKTSYWTDAIRLCLLFPPKMKAVTGMAAMLALSNEMQRGLEEEPPRAGVINPGESPET